MTQSIKRSILIAFSFSLVNFTSFAQKTCFDGCWTRMEKSESPFAPIDILKELQGCDAPDFNVRTIDGEEISFKSLRDHVIVINFWFIGCKPCVEEMPRLNDLVDQYKDKNVVFLSFARDIEDDIRKKFLPKRIFKYKIIPEAHDIIKRYCVLPYPTHFVIEKSGKVAYTAFDSIMKEGNYQKFKAAIESAVGK